MQKTELFFYSHPSRKRRVTIAAVVDRQNHVLNLSYAECSDNDLYLKDRGKHIALERAAKKPIVGISYTEEQNPYKAFVAVSVFLMENLNKMQTYKKGYSKMCVNMAFDTDNSVKLTSVSNGNEKIEQLFNSPIEVKDQAEKVTAL